MTGAGGNRKDRAEDEADLMRAAKAARVEVMDGEGGGV